MLNFVVFVAMIQLAALGRHLVSPLNLFCYQCPLVLAPRVSSTKHFKFQFDPEVRATGLPALLLSVNLTIKVDYYYYERKKNYVFESTKNSEWKKKTQAE